MSRVAVVGAGWAGLAAAVRLVQRGASVTVFETAAQAGGRARRISSGGHTLDNGQHILIGAYSATLGLMRELGADPQRLLRRLPLTLVDPQGRGLRLPPGPPMTAFVRGVAACERWRWRERAALLWTALGWLRRGFACPPDWSVARLCADLPTALRADLIEPLCVAALNTPADEASGQVFLRVLHDALFSGPGAADLLLPAAPLDALLPAPATRWLRDAGATLRLGRRVTALAPGPDGGWRLDGEDFDAAVLACPAAEAARLAEGVAPGWSALARGLRYEPIVTVTLACPGARLAAPMVALPSDAQTAPAQFVFDQGALGQTAGHFSFVISGAAPWVAQGREATSQAVLGQAVSAFPAGTWPRPPTPVAVIAERRATFRCTPGLQRPPAAVAGRLWAAGDHVDGPYPATLEGAVRAGEHAAAMVVGA